MKCYLQVVPVLHQHIVSLIYNDHLDGRQKVEIPLLIAFSANDSFQTQRRGEDQISRIKVRVKLQSLAGELDAYTEVIINVSFEGLQKVG